MTKSIGIIGITGRVGSILAEVIQDDRRYHLGTSISKSTAHSVNIENVFIDNDYIIDFSSYNYTAEILDAALCYPKPLVICTTNWDQSLLSQKIELLGNKTSVVIAPNTSIGSCLQRYIIRKLSEYLDSEYDIDIVERHHRYKVDSPSGTAKSFVSDIQNIKKTVYDLDYIIKDGVGPREDHAIYIASERSGNLSGEHDVRFINSNEEISIKHRSFTRTIYAQGALKAVEWVAKNKENGVFNMMDVFGLS